MLVQSETLWPMFKWWAPMSMGSWALSLFGGVTFVSFLDALVARGWLRLGPWRGERQLHGTRAGLLLSLLGGGLGFFVGAYSGVLLSVTSIPGWRDTTWIGALFLATAGATGMAALLLIGSLRRAADPAQLAALERTTTWVIVYQMVMLAIFLFTAQPAAGEFLSGLPLVALILAVVLGGVAPLVIHFGSRRPRPSLLATYGALVLVAGLLIRYAVVMGPQHGVF
jgi:formate-dependent nitrite reductase membrane component NrfD